MKKIFHFGLLWICFILFWLLYVYQFNLKEVLAGVCASGLAFVPLWLSRRAEKITFQPELHWVLQTWRLPGEIVRGCGVLLRQMGRTILRKKSESTFQVARFIGTTDQRRQLAQRALAITLATVPPNSLVVGIDTEADLILFHQVKKVPVPEIIRQIEG